MPSNLPALLTPFVGREEQVEAICTLIRDENVRLLVLTGPGGVGKTRLAIRALGELVPNFEDGVFYVRLASISDPDLVLPAIAHTLGIKEDDGYTLDDSLRRYLGDRSLLLLLDNFEQVISAAPQVTALLPEAPGVQMVITSRTLLQVYGEHEYEVPPMALPQPVKSATFEQLARAEAVRFFVIRTREMRPNFELTSENAQAAGEICDRLDGLPLAIELAAARTRLFTPQALLVRLDKRLPLLTSVTRDAPARQQTLRNAIAWSYDLLNSDEQRLFITLAVFAGGFTLEAVEHVAAQLQLEPYQLLGKLESLIAKSLLRQREQEGVEPRFAMLATIREYAMEKLDESGALSYIQHAHAAYFLTLAQEALSQIPGPQQQAWLEKLESEHDNFRAALAWSQQPPGGAGQRELGAKLAASLSWFWRARGYHNEGMRWANQTLSALDAEQLAQPETWLADAFRAAGGLVSIRGDYTRSIELTEKSLEIARKLGDKRSTARSLNNLGVLATHQGDYQKAEQFYNESAILKRESEDKSELVVALQNLARIDRARGRYENAMRLYEEGLTIARQMGDKFNQVLYLDFMGLAEREQGRFEQAVALLEECLALCEEIGYSEMKAHALGDLGKVMCDQGNNESAIVYLEESLELHRLMEEHEGISHVRTDLGRVATHRGEYAQARTLLRDALRPCLQKRDYSLMTIEILEYMADLDAQSATAERTQEVARRGALLLGLIEDRRERMGTPVPPVGQNIHKRIAKTLREVLGAKAFEAARTKGRSMELQQAATLTLRDTYVSGANYPVIDSLPGQQPSTLTPPPIPLGHSNMGLTEREIDVLRLVASGLTNKETGERLQLSPRTVQTHLYSIFSKLDVTTRSGATRYAVERKLV